MSRASVFDSAPDAEWAAHSDPEMGQKYGATKQAARSYRRARNKPASPALQGGWHGAHSRIIISAGVARIGRWSAAAARSRLPLETWLAEIADAASEEAEKNDQ